MNRKDMSVLCAISMLILVISASPSMAQVFIVFPGGASFRFNFMAPSEVEAGKIFEVIAFAEHVSGSPVGIPLLRVMAQPSPVVVPIVPTSGETPLYCDPNWCAYPWMTGMDQESKKMKFMVDPNAPPGQILILKVDVSNNGRQPWQNVEDIRVTVRVIPPCTQPCTRWDPTTNTCAPVTCTIGQQCDPVSNSCVVVQPPDFTMSVQDPQPQPVEAGKSATANIVINVNPSWKGEAIVFTVSAPGLVVTLSPSTLTTSGTCSLIIQVPNDAEDAVVPIRVVASGAGATHDWSGQMIIRTPFDWTWIIIGVVTALVAIGIIAVWMLTRRRPPRAAAAYKPYPAAPTAPQAVTLKPGAPQAVKPVTHAPRVVARREEKE